MRIVLLIVAAIELRTPRKYPAYIIIYIYIYIILYALA